MKALVTGGAGFIGSNVVRKFLESGIETVVFDNLSSGHRVNLEGLETEFIEGDICDLEALFAIDGTFDAVIHLAASVGRQKSIDNPLLDSMVNVIGSLNVIEFVKRRKVPKIVYSSSAAIFGELKTDVIDEEHSLHPDSPYGVSKLAAEKHFLAAADIYGFNAICLRYFNVFGNNQRYDAYGNVIPIFADRLLHHQPLTIFGDGEQTRDFIHVEQVARANLMAGSGNVPGGVYNLGSGERMTINDLSILMKKISGINCVENDYQPERKGDVRHCRADIRRFVNAFHYKPLYDMAEDLSSYWDWFTHSMK